MWWSQNSGSKATEGRLILETTFVPRDFVAFFRSVTGLVEFIISLRAARRACRPCRTICRCVHNAGRHRPADPASPARPCQWVQHQAGSDRPGRIETLEQSGTMPGAMEQMRGGHAAWFASRHRDVEVPQLLCQPLAGVFIWANVSTKCCLRCVAPRLCCPPY